MRKIAVFVILCSWGNVNFASRVLYDSFENGVPAHFQLYGSGKLGVSHLHYKHGNKSLRWDWQENDFIKINNSLGDLDARGGYGKNFLASFGIWIYMQNPVNDILHFEFCRGKNKGGTFEVSLNFKGWQRVYVNYRSPNPNAIINFSGYVSSETDNIIIRSPELVKKGIMFIDLIVYNGIWDPRRVQAPRKELFAATKINDKKYPLKKLSARECTGLKKAEKVIESYYIPSYPKTFNMAKTADEIFKKYNIIKDKYGIRGEGIILERGISEFKTNSIFYTLNGVEISREKNYFQHYVDDLKILSQLYYYAKDKKLRTKIANYFSLMNEHMIDQGFNKYCALKAYAYTIGSYGDIAILMKDVLKKQGLLKDCRDYIFSNNDFFAPANAKAINMDYFYHNAIKSFSFAMMLDNTQEQVQAFYFLRDKLSREICTDNLVNGFKPDGSGYHHMRYYPAYMRNAIRSIAKVTYALSDTPFQITESAFNVIKKAVLNLRFCVNEKCWPVGLRGRHPELHYVIRPPRKLVMSKIDGKIDPELAAMYLRFNMDKELLSMGFKPEKTPTGALAMPYAGILAFRRKQWLALAQSYGKYYYSTEINAGKNRFGRYTTNGALDIIGPGGVVKSGTSDAGWDWNRMNGATVIYYPEAELRPVTSGTECLFTPYGFFGGITWRGRNGCFTMQIYGEPYNESFTGKKTYFMLGEKIIALGSDIKNNERRYPTQTNLYQKALSSKDVPTYVDGYKDIAFPEKKTLDRDRYHCLLDPAGNGYYVPRGQTVAVARKHQNMRNSRDDGYAAGNFATAWLEHGKSPRNAGYEYVILPYCGEKKLVEFSRLANSGRAYKVLQKNRYGHVVHDLTSNIYGAVFYEKQSIRNLTPLLHVSRNCMVMFKKAPGKLEISAGDPDVNRPGTRWNWGPSKINPLKISFRGEGWKLFSADKGVRIINLKEKGITTVECLCVDGKTFNFTLKKTTKRSLL